MILHLIAALLATSLWYNGIGSPYLWVVIVLGNVLFGLREARIGNYFH